MIGTPFGRDAEFPSRCGRKGVLHGSEGGPHTPVAGNLSLPGLVFLFAISLIPFTPWNGAKADTPAVTDIRIVMARHPPKFEEGSHQIYENIVSVP